MPSLYIQIYFCLDGWRNEWRRCRFHLQPSSYHPISISISLMQPWHHGPYWVLPGNLNAAQAPTSQLSTFLHLLFCTFQMRYIHAYFLKLSEGLFWQFVGNCKIFAQNNSIGFVDDWFWHFSLDWILVWAAELDWNISISFQPKVLIYLDGDLWVVHLS